MFPLRTISGAWKLWLRYLWRWCQWIIAMLKRPHHRKINLPSFVFFVWSTVIHWAKRNGSEFFWGSCLLIHYVLETGGKWLRKLKFIEIYFSGKAGCVSWNSFLKLTRRVLVNEELSRFCGRAPEEECVGFVVDGSLQLEVVLACWKQHIDWSAVCHF